MEDVYEHSVLADQFDSSDEDLRKPSKEKRHLAPIVNPISSARKVSLKRLFIDSRDRNRTHFPNANNFTMSMTVPLKVVKSITLTNAKIPLVQGYDYVVVVLRTLKDRTLHLPKESPGFPGGVLAIFPLVAYKVGLTYAYYKSDTNQKNGGSQGGWKINFPQGYPMLNELQFQLYAWHWDAVNNCGETVLLPLTGEPILNVEPAVANNTTYQLEIEHDLQ